MKILFCHFGIKDKSGFGRTFMLAKGIAALGHDLTFLTNQNEGFKFPYRVEIRDKVKIISFPDFLPKKILGLGFGGLSILLKLLYVTNKKFDIVHSDNHRPSAAFPCVWNRLIYKAKYISEWWDNYGRGGQYDNKHWLFKMFLGWYEIRTEIKNHLKADGVVVLSEETRERAISNKIDDRKITIIHGGANIDYIDYYEPFNSKHDNQPKITFGYIGMSDGELVDLEPFIKAFSRCSKKMDIIFQTFGKKISRANKSKYELTKMLESGWVNYFNNADALSRIDVYILIKANNAINKAGWPNKLGDYLAAGRPVLLNPYGDLCWFSQKHPKGLILTEWNESDIEKKINDIYNGKYDLNQMGKYNRRIAENEYSWMSQSSKLEKFYKTILIK